MTDPSSPRPGSRLDAPPRGKRVRTPRRAAERSRAVALGRLLRAVAHPLRLQIIDLLREHDLHVTALCERLGAPQAVVSQQLRILRLSGVVEPRREHSFVRYRLAHERLVTLARVVGRWGGKPSAV